MKEIVGHASAVVAAPVDECFALLRAVDDYPSWSGELVREVEVLETDAAGHPTRARAVIHVAYRAFARDVEVVLAVRAEPPRVVSLTRLPNEHSDREQLELAWRLEPGTEMAIDLKFRATVSVPALTPLPRVGDTVAESLLGAAKQRLEDPIRGT